MWVCVSMCVCVGVSVSVRVRARVSARACLQRLVFVCLRVVSSYPARSITRCLLALSRLPGAFAAVRLQSYPARATSDGAWCTNYDPRFTAWCACSRVAALSSSIMHSCAGCAPDAAVLRGICS